MHPLIEIRNQRGVALPLALLGLVIVSFLVTAAIVTSGSEVLSSSAHQQGTTALYKADGLLERYVARKADKALSLSDSLSPTPPGGDSKWGFRFDVARLYTRLDTLPGDTLAQNQTYSVLASPDDKRGRSVGVLVPTSRRAKMFAVNMPAALTVGGNVDVAGASTISDGRNTGCGAAPNAVQATKGSSITRQGQAVIEGKADTASFDKSELIDRYLGGQTLAQSAADAKIKFAAGEFAGKASSLDQLSLPKPQTDKYNWGCPSADACALVLGNESNLAYYPTIAIDAGGGKVQIDGNHGQGILIIHNGSAEFKGSFMFKGIILVEKDVVIQGNSSLGGVKIDGTVMALGQNSSVADNVSGSATITYNRCVVETMTNPINIPRVLSAPQRFLERPHSWFEVIR